jgi:DNA invertase Pin-like site-specific DNA recombinase
MAAYGYARVSTLDQDLTVQRRALRAAGCSVIRAEKKTGNRRDGRTELQVLLDFRAAGRTGTAAGKAFLDMLGVFAEFETNLRRERQLEGIAQAKARGVYRGRKPSIDMAEIRRLRDQDGLGATAIARRLGIGRASVYRALGAP